MARSYGVGSRGSGAGEEGLGESRESRVAMGVALGKSSIS